MPPKKAPAAASKKTEQKKKEKVIEDKTFGIKNKKGAKQQKFIQQVEKQVKSGGIHPAGPMQDKKKDKEQKLKEAKELAALFKPVQTQKVEKGTDPKSVVCAFFKQGQCTKGDRCKFSHDLTIERKAEKRSLYVDMRDDDTMDNWDEEKLKEVVEKKHADDKQRPTTDIICKHFLEAVEKSKYGWFWECPSGGRCIYRHALPPGFVLKRDKKKMEEKKNEISLVDLIERERAALGPNQTKITLETFLAWKKKKIKEKQDNIAAAEEQKRSDFKAGRACGLSGREMFSFDPALAADDDDADDGDAVLAAYGDDGDDDANEYREITFDGIGMEASEVDDTGTKATSDRLQQLSAGLSNGDAAAAAEAEEAEEEAEEAEAAAVPINENLFLDDELDEELQGLDLDD
ncbi:zinc finger CCCH domain-containing protein 15 homolog [Cydia splendana]|uniref:zinc finger CCCH domain-containing protein 15 homolog n=1 Tax=Cydia splendana TaxID=1100963 RepID=UPI00211FAE9B